MQRFHYFRDALGSVTGLMDDEGVAVEGYMYSPYGQTLIISPGDDAYMHWGVDEPGWPSDDEVLPESAYGNPYQYTARRVDPETGLYYYRARMYDPDMGRFISRDPIGDWGDAGNMGNGYAYVGGAPTAGTDPSGLHCLPPCVDTGVDPFAAAALGGKLHFDRDGGTRSHAGRCWTFWSCTYNVPSVGFTMAVFNVEGNSPNLSCARMESIVKDGIKIIADAIGWDIRASVHCKFTIPVTNAGASIDLHDPCAVADHAYRSMGGPAGVEAYAAAFLDRGSENGCAEDVGAGNGVAITDRPDGFRWPRSVLAAHEIAHLWGAEHVGRTTGTNAQLLLSCVDHVWATFMNFCDAAIGDQRLDDTNANRIKRHLERVGTA